MGADAAQRPHHERQVVRRRLEQHALGHVLVSSDVHARQPAGLVAVRVAALGDLVAPLAQTLSSSALHATAVRVHGVACLLVVLPATAVSVGLARLAAHAQLGQAAEHVVAVVALVEHDILHASFDVRRLDTTAITCFMAMEP
ncbi:MAG: hypothetical protein H6825_16825 [Planctomycetes bacterium]|nr:hypothetical protein [Planctomycetota bacterium]